MTPNITLKYTGIVFIAVLLSCLFHELTHWSVGEILGNKMSLSLNSVSVISGEYKNEWNRNYITISAPIFTVLQAIAFYFVVNRSKNINFYPFLFFPFVYRLAAGLANMLGPNDEGRFGLSLGLGLYTISILFCSFLLFLVYRSSQINKITLKFNALTFLVCALSLLAIVFVTDYYQLKIIE